MLDTSLFTLYYTVFQLFFQSNFTDCNVLGLGLRGNMGLKAHQGGVFGVN